MKKAITVFFILSVIVSVLYIPNLVQSTSTTATKEELIQLLKKQIEELKAQIETLNTQLESLGKAKIEVKETAKEIKGTLQLLRQLRLGMTGEDVKSLQEILATDPDIYPEGKITGYFGSLTEKAVKRFQTKAGIEQAGVVGPKTLSKINELLTEGAGASGKVPPGLLIAPGIREKLGFAPQPLPGQKLPPGIAKKLEGTTDNLAPIISEISAIDTTTTSATIIWVTNELSNSKVWYNTSTPLVISNSTPMKSSSNLVLNHRIALFSLVPDSTYYYLVSSTDAVGNVTTSSEQLFRTLSE